MSKAKTSLSKATAAGLIIGIVGIVLSILFYFLGPVSEALYRVRVTVVNPQQVPVEDARVWSSFGGEPKKVAGGWQFDIPEAAKPKDSRLTFYASKESAFLTGKKEVFLDKDYNPSVTIELKKDTTSMVRGIVVDETGKALKGAQVSIVGYGDEMITTNESGQFALSAHASQGQQVMIHAQKDGYTPANQWHPAGDEPATVILEQSQ